MLPGPIGASAAHGALESAGLILRDAGGRWTAVRPPARTGLGGEKAEAVDGYVRAAVERLGDWPVPQRLIEALAPETAVPAATVFLSEPKLTAADRAATARWMANGNAMGQASAAPPA